MSSCRKDFDFEVSSCDLRFSKDTVFLDTIFANISSSTYVLKVYNDSSRDLSIPTIRLRQDASNYRLNVDGLSGQSFDNIPLLANDSLFVFIETVLPQTQLEQAEFLNTDAIQFIGSQNTQEVQLVSLVKDANFLFPQEDGNGMSETLLIGIDEDGNELRIDGFFLEEEELVFSNEKPIVVYGYAAVPPNRTLTIEAGARVHFHKNSGLIIGNTSSLHVLGSLSQDLELLENEVIFEGDRLEPEFADVGGQWGTIWFFPESTDNQLEHLTIKNATIGLFCEGTENDETIRYQMNNLQIYNSSSTNLWARTANIVANNCVFGNAGEVSAYLNLGGSYDFKHCTLANYWTASFRSSPTLLIDNILELQPDVFIQANLTKATFGNCIIDGNQFLELGLVKSDTKTFNFQFKNCLIQFDDRNSDFTDNPLFNFADLTNYDEIGLNMDVGFSKPLSNDFNLLENSAAIGFGDSTISLSVPLDLVGSSRANQSDVGAYNYIPQ
ncbi:hypothetical protein [Croceivirga thetidis]|uniref:hypothetical protein n=1 Tax=Croceivirga thetidis TaxID=2721623 RepID=UPI001FF0AA56|nr:hypothetical protein [Croceivirga thetidis]